MEGATKLIVLPLYSLEFLILKACVGGRGGGVSLLPFVAECCCLSLFTVHTPPPPPRVSEEDGRVLLSLWVNSSTPDQLPTYADSILKYCR